VEQIKLETILDPARQALSNTASAMAWLEGWSMRMEEAVEEALRPQVTSS
jgi:hypothetical protein